MKVDREAYSNHFEASVKDLMQQDKAFKTALEKDDIDSTEEIAKEKLLERPKYYFSLESLQKAYQTSNNLIDFLRKAAGRIEKLPDKYDRLNQGFEEFKLTHANTPYDKLHFYENIYSCYLTSPEYRTAIESGNLTVLDDQTLGGNVPVGRITRGEIDEVVSHIKESNIAYVN